MFDSIDTNSKSEKPIIIYEYIWSVILKNEEKYEVEEGDDFWAKWMGR